MGNGKTRTVTAVSAWGVALVLALGWPAGDAAAASSSAPPPQPVTATPGAGVPAQPLGGTGCIIGLNCGCMRNKPTACPKPRPRPNPPGPVGESQHSTPAHPPAHH
ncbi:hypothetical protein KXD96_15950 [Mycobacterium sp. SMC-2]|uniref:hypothetical protein n=1 Tax=Mycobacterium sp. SMC-2 TaxID=2857058 RepID=UPI0021B4B590|nr:hypothetical protein [Mycobacterium sp. SMC-2]UXA04508.1 hypothetical protein KXD96_15950 [Mycobacterium sp. SMC-2]